jgi:putative transposase
MPKRNSVKVYGENRYYHVYNRGVNKQDIFLEDVDYHYFLGLLKRHLSPEQTTDKYGRVARNYAQEVELNAYCLMPNHYHLLFYLKEKAGLAHLMRSIMTNYAMYFNRKYDRSGGLYEGVFLAAPITNDYYLWHVTRYIHLNPVGIGKKFRAYPYSSLGYYAGEKTGLWIHPERLVESAEEQTKYMEFVADYETMQQDIENLLPVLAAE